MEEILEEYLENVLPHMINRGYHLRLAKGGIDFPHLSEQTMLSHILTGMFGLSSLLTYLDNRGILPFDETEFRRVITLYTLHDMHKIETERMNKSDFSLPLESIENEYQQLGLHEFADVNLHELRAANVSSRSTYHGDIMLGDEGSMRRWRLVRIADAMASVSSPDEIGSIWNHMQHLDPRLALNYYLYYHRLCDIRGVLTNQIHAHVANQLIKHDFFPLLFFASGNIYLGPKNVSTLDRSQIIDSTVHEITGQLQPIGGFSDK